MTKANFDELEKIIKQAGEIFKKGFYSSKDVSFKGKKDLITQYDVEVERFLKDKLSRLFANHSIIAEESDGNVYEINNTIIIDPIDGTTNFVNSLPHCAISVGIYTNAKEDVGVVYNPILDEFVYGVATGDDSLQVGAFLNHEPIQVSGESEFDKALLATGFPYSCSNSKQDLNFVLDSFKNVLPKCQDIRRLGSASVDLCMVARGIYEGYFEIGLKAWDISAGIIILKLAGGKVSEIDGSDINIFNHKCIIATNGAVHNKLVELLS